MLGYAILRCKEVVKTSLYIRKLPRYWIDVMSETKTTTPAAKSARPTWKPAARVHAAEQPFTYPLKREFVEPDWRRLPGYKGVSKEEWEAALWQRRHTAKNLKELKDAFGDLIPDTLMASLERDIKERATMSILVPPHMLNTMDEKDLWNDPVRRYMLPAFDDRHPEWPSHPKASRDSLHESDMWAVEGLTHRYPTKVLAEMLSTCPQYCGHCTRMDLVGNDVPQVIKLKFQIPQKDRYQQMLDYLRVTPSVRDVVVSGGDIANVPIGTLEDFVSKLMDIPNIRDIRLATKGLIAIPQHFLQSEVQAGLARLAKKARERGVDIAVHTHVNNARQVTPLVRKAVESVLDMGFRDVRNQGVLLRGVNTTPNDLLELCFALLDYGKILPYYFYQCDMIPNALAPGDPRSAAVAARHHGLPAWICHAPYRLRCAVCRQAVGAPGEGVRPATGNLLLDKKLPHGN
jgi:lysine 2,3-aminomutase